jgi:HSP20 family molecular chaperone IbpA
METVMPPRTAADPSFSNISRQANRLIDQMQKAYFNFCPSETWTPSVNLYETYDAYLVCVDLAGVDKDKIEVEVTGQVLKLRGTRAVPAHEDAAAEPGHQGPRRVRIHLMEIDHGGFCREVELPEDVDKDRIAANHRNGLLWIELPKTAVREAAEAQAEV